MNPHFDSKKYKGHYKMKMEVYDDEMLKDSVDDIIPEWGAVIPNPEVPIPRYILGPDRFIGLPI